MVILHNNDKTVMRKTIIVSGVNLSEGGPLSIMRSLLNYLEQSDLANEYIIYALVHSKKLYPNIRNIELLEYPDVNKSWGNRVIFEYFRCRRISRDLNAYLWLSMHDVTPNVTAMRRSVYCHNAIAFYKTDFHSFFSNPKMYIYTVMYKYLYRINISKNDYVIVQQKWLKDIFQKMYKLDPKKIIVAQPVSPEFPTALKSNLTSTKAFQFIYPAFPRHFKNFEVICRAAERLENKAVQNFRIILTIDGSENDYSKKIVEKYQNLQCINFVGLQNRENIEGLYASSDCLIFPSKLETWGLPISEFKRYKKPILTVDLPYAHETVGNYEKVRYFSAEDDDELSVIMLDLLNDELTFNNKGTVEYNEPLANGWGRLMKYLLKNGN